MEGVSLVMESNKVVLQGRPWGPSLRSRRYSDTFPFATSPHPLSFTARRALILAETPLKEPAKFMTLEDTKSGLKTETSLLYRL